ncbi:MAG TPA: 23S rRNA (guanosine(2251)-2'-O)-methyltransferase RlmB [Clostridiales bacterium]|nr:23S rRNA (guanosine(2251)-2'-O)-methyltransferase RlmB [Clostridiales bacterium]
MNKEGQAKKPYLIIGKNAVKEALNSDRPVDYVLVAKGDKKNSLMPLIAKCREKGIVVKEADVKKLDFACGHGNHQGIIMYAAAHEYCTIDDIFDKAEEMGEAPFIVICDGIEDPHNLGAIIRTAEAAGVHGVIIPERRSVGLNFTVGKTAAGALEYMLVARVKNLNTTIEDIKSRGVWVWAADVDGIDYKEADFGGGVALIIGSEGNGISRLVKKNADGVVSVPMKGKINSLNASVAAAVLMFEISSRRY